MPQGACLIYDFGTTALKTVLFDKELNEVDSTSREFHYHYPAENQIELDPETYWDYLVSSTREIVQRNNCQESIEVISLTGQAETLIPIDRNGTPLRQAIVWLDTRSEEESTSLSRKIAQERFYRLTGLTAIDPILPVTKLQWLNNHEPEIYRHSTCLLLLRDFIVHRLCGRMVTDPSIASCSGYFDISTRQWSEEILHTADVDPSLLPEIEETDAHIGTLLPGVRDALGLKKQVVVMNGMLDQCASAIGAGNVMPGILTEITGTVLALCYTIERLEDIPQDAPIPVVCHGVPGKYLLLPYSPTAGMVLKWFKDQFCHEEEERAQREGKNPYELMTEPIDPNTPPDSRLLLIPHFSGSLFPVTDPRSCGVVFGLTLGTRKEDVVRAILESVGFVLRESVEYLSNHGFPVTRIISLGGGSRSHTWLKLKSTILNRQIETLKYPESTARGCACVAAHSLGWVDRIEELSQDLTGSNRYQPIPSNIMAYEGKYHLFLKLFQSLYPVFHSSSDAEIT